MKILLMGCIRGDGKWKKNELVLFIFVLVRIV